MKQQATEQKATTPHIRAQNDVLGIDVSHHQKEIDWSIVFDSTTLPIGFVCHKATQGISFTSPKLESNWASCKKIGYTMIQDHKYPIIQGAYHIFTSEDKPIDQAKHFCTNLQKIGFKETDYNGKFYALYLEENAAHLSPQDLAKNASSFLGYTKAQYPLTKSYIHTRTNFCNDNLKDQGEEIFKNHGLWLARYFKNSGNDVILKVASPVDDKCGLPIGAHDCDIWQYTDKGVVPGITGSVDLNIWKYSDFAAVVGDFTGEFTS